MLVFWSSFSLAQEGVEKEWLFVSFINGHNNLNDEALADINEMETVGSTDDIHVVVQWGNQKSSTKRLYITQDSDPKKVNSVVVQDFKKKVDMGNVSEFVDFVTWAIQKYPAKRIFVNVWNHGSGWRPASFSTRDISYDDNTGNAISTMQLGEALATVSQALGRPIDIYGSDACLMAMAELASQLKNSDLYMVSSEDLEPGDGWPYAQFLNEWNQDATADTVDIAKKLTSLYVEKYVTDGVYDITLSVVDLSQQSDFEAAMSEFGAEVLKLSSPQLQVLSKKLKRISSIYYFDYVDLGQILDETFQLNLTQDLTKATMNAQKAFKNLVVDNQVGFERSEASGLSIWFPDQYRLENLRELYTELEWEKSAQWLRAVEVLQ